MKYLLNLLYMSLYSVWHQEDLFLSIDIGISHTYGIAEDYPNSILLAWIPQQMNYCINEVFAEFIVHVTVQCLASGRLVSQHWNWHQPYLWHSQMLCQFHSVGVNTTTNELLCKWSICWIYCTCHYTVQHSASGKFVSWHQTQHHPHW